MGVALLEIGVKVKKGVIFTVRGCLKSVWNHPFLVGMLCFLILLYRTSPFVFHLLVSASPILVCTAVLLGTLLSFGQPNIPEIEVEEERTSVGSLSIKTGVLGGDVNVVERNGSHYVERFSGSRWDESEKSVGGVLREEGSDDAAPLIEERSRGVGLIDDGEELGGQGELGELRELRVKEKSEWIEEKLDDRDVRDDDRLDFSDAKVNGGLIESDDEKSEAESFDSEKVNVDSLDSPPHSPWARVVEREVEEPEKGEDKDEEEDEASDSESDYAESSSPDASMADIMPMLDELHPLLDEEGPRTVDDVASEKSMKSSHHHSDSESENHLDLEEEEEAGDDEIEDGENHEETKAAISWTEQDQKNLMDLGTSEIERNQRLENLILRRRARKSTNLFTEMNLIDLESSDLPFNIAPISTRRPNPFDLPHDNYDDLGLPPIPGSAPSVLLQRRNPFDIPYDSSEEKPDLKGDGFQEEFASQPKEHIFRRHESFNVGPSMFAPRKHDVKMRPYFVPERTISEESSSSLFQRQSSGLSDSKVSSVPETESVTSVEDLEESKLLEREVVESRVEQAQMEDVSDHYEEGSASRYAEFQNIEGVESRHSRDSSSSSLSEVSERVFIDTEGDRISTVEGRRDEGGEEPSISTQTSLGSTDLNTPSPLAINISQRAPVYDLSPREIEGNHGEMEVEIPRTIEMLSDSSVSHSVAAESTMEKHILDDVSVSVDDKNIHTAAESSDHQDLEHQSSDSDADIQPETDEKLISMHSSEGDSSLFYDNSIQEPDFNYLNEVQASSTPVESFLDSQVTRDLNTSEVQELDHYINSPSSPELISILPNAIEENSSRFDVQTVVEEADEIKEIDEGLLAELDNVGDFSIGQLVSGPSEYETNVESVGEESLSSALYAETSATRAVEVNKMEQLLLSEESRQHIDVYEEDVERNSEMQTCQTENVKVPKFDEYDHDSLNQETSVQETRSIRETVSGIPEMEVDTYTTSGMAELEASSIEAIDLDLKEISSKEIEKHVVLDPSHAELQNREDSISAIPEPEMLSIDDIDAVPEKGESASVETEIVRNTSSDASVPEASIIEEIDLAFKHTSSQANEKPLVLEPVDADTPSLVHDVEATEIEDIDLASEQMISMEIEKHVVLEPSTTELPNYEDAHAVSEHTELTSVETGVVGTDVSSQGQVYTETTSEITEIEATAVEESDLAPEQVVSKTIDLDPVDKDSISRARDIEASSVETIAEHSEEAAPHRDTSSPVFTNEVSVLEVGPDAIITDKNEADIATGIDGIHNSVDKTKPSEEAVLHSDRSVMVSTEVAPILEVGQKSQNKDASLDDQQLTDRPHDSVQHTLCVAESGETQGASSELHVAEAVPSKGATLHSSRDLDGEKLKSDDEAVEVSQESTHEDEAEKDLDSKSSAKGKGKLSRSSSSSSSSNEAVEVSEESSVRSVEKPTHEDEAEKDLDSKSSGKGKGKLSRSSSSSSSSSSDSSSSDSDKE